MSCLCFLLRWFHIDVYEPYPFLVVKCPLVTSDLHSAGLPVPGQSFFFPIVPLMSPDCNSSAWYPHLERGRRSPICSKRQTASQWWLNTVSGRGNGCSTGKTHTPTVDHPPGFPVPLAPKPSPGDMGFHQYLPPAFFDFALCMASLIQSLTLWGDPLATLSPPVNYSIVWAFAPARCPVS